MIEAIDKNLIYAFSKPVDVWCSWTGKSNFTLARVLVFVICALILGDMVVALIFFSVSAWFLLRVVATAVLLALLRSSWRRIARLEKAVKEMETSDVYPLVLYFVVERARTSRVLFLVLGIYFLSNLIALILSDGWFPGRIFVAIPLLLSVYEYILICFNGGGGGKIRQAIRKLASVKLWRTPVARPTPA